MFTQAELTSIDARLYEPAQRKLALTLRKVVQVNRMANPYDLAIGYSKAEGKGKARVRRAGSDSKDKKHSAVELTPATQPIYVVDDHIKFTIDEVERARRAAALQRAPYVPIEEFKIRNSQRIVDEAVDRIGFVGAPDGSVKGILNSDGIQTGEAAKKLNTLTPPQQLKVLRDLFGSARYNGTYRPGAMIVPPWLYDMLRGPYSDQNPMSLFSWFQTQGADMPTPIESQAMLAENNELGSDCIVVFDPNPEYIELSLPVDLKRGEPFKVDHEEYEIRVESRTGGIILREPKSVAVLTKII